MIPTPGDEITAQSVEDLEREVVERLSNMYKNGIDHGMLALAICQIILLVSGVDLSKFPGANAYQIELSCTYQVIDRVVSEPLVADTHRILTPRCLDMLKIVEKQKKSCLAYVKKKDRPTSNSSCIIS
jgi:hypothetical protein